MQAVPYRLIIMWTETSHLHDAFYVLSLKAAYTFTCTCCFKPSVDFCALYYVLHAYFNTIRTVCLFA